MDEVVDVDQYADQKCGSAFAMPTFMYRCPIRLIHAHAWIADEVHAASGNNEFVAIPCLACQQAHLMNPRTGALAGAGDTKPPTS
jgi:hypothetical protein